MKSQEEFYLRLQMQLVRSDPLVQSSVKHLNRDVKTLRSRVTFEGLSFLTKTLPLLGKALDQGLENGKFNLPYGFTSQQKTSRPAFMQSYFNLVFDEDCNLRDVAPAEAIGHLRQVLYFAYKLEAPYSVAENRRVIEGFIQTDADLALLQFGPASDILSLARLITGKVFNDFNHEDIHPQHGPGAVATGERLEGKWRFSRRFSSVESVYPFHRYYLVGGMWSNFIDGLDRFPPITHESGCAKVVLVPKDSRGPRLISCEPLEYQWIQQGLGRKLQDFLEFVSTYTRNQVNFTRQEINSEHAKTSSASQRFATLDLKDASDRVSLGLVRRIFSDTPGLLRALEACRTTETKLPDGRIVPLQKFAPMGSALCFPVEAFVFWVIIVSEIVRLSKLPLEKVGNLVFVYGDDIVVPTEWAQASIQALESVGLLVNRDKSCIMGYFRESCGTDAYKGIDVTPLRLKTPWTNRSSDGSAYVAYIALANHMDQRGYKLVGDAIWESLISCYGKIPYGTLRASYPCRIVTDATQAILLNQEMFRSRVSRNYQRIEFFLPCLSSRKMRSGLDGWPRLLRNLVSPPFSNPSVVVLPRSTKLKRGWAPVF